jgi:hypothetical protein
LIRQTESGGTWIVPVESCRVLYVSEESKEIWRERQQKFGFGENVKWIPRPFLGKPTQEQWQGFCEQVAELVEAGEFDFVILDTWTDLSPAESENDAAATMNALRPLRFISEAGAAVLIVHHSGKQGLTGLRSARGSSALGGFVDIFLQLRPLKGKGARQRTRSITSRSRFDGTPASLTIELTKDGGEYKRIGAGLEGLDKIGVIQALLKEHPGSTVKQILDHWPKDAVKPKEPTLQEILRSGLDTFWTRKGKGSKTDPHRYTYGGSPPPH